MRRELFLHRHATSGFTIIELLVVIGVIGVLVALLLPAIHSVRESARRSECSNNLRQLAIGIRSHETAHKTFPTGGWGQDWLGDPDAGYGTKQPGGWIYNILSVIEQDDLRQLGRGLTGPKKQQALQELTQHPVAILYCPSRRPSQLYPYTGGALKNAAPPSLVAKTDYAISSTISFIKSEVIMPDVQLHGKGASKTALCGEKWIAAQDYDTGSPGDKLVAFVGDSEDIRRAPGVPTSDRTSGKGFGGPHAGGANIAYCDASVRFVLDNEDMESSE
jgi:prepilin-type N-terminal cleavage/methylation domain-containing protein/prepilin-type processing-associated H-X9-DG protein